MDLEIFGIRKKRRADGLLIILQKLIILTKREITRVHERNKTVKIKKNNKKNRMPSTRLVHLSTFKEYNKFLKASCILFTALHRNAHINCAM